MSTGRTTTTQAEPEALTFDLGPDDGTARRVDLWLPHTESVELVALAADAPLHPVPTAERTWLHHGSSISQGSNAATHRLIGERFGAAVFAPGAPFGG